MKNKRAQRRLGLILMASSLAVMAVAPLALATEGVPEGGTPTEPTKVAVWNGDKSNYANNVATSQFPPQAVCLVQPAACFFPEDESPQGQLGGLGNETLRQLNEQEQTLLDFVEENDSGAPAEPAYEPGDLPVSVAFGAANYRTGLQIDLPAVPDGQQLDSFAIVLQEGQPTYASESPAFRQAVTAALTCASDDPDSPIGRCNQDSFENVQKACNEESSGPCLSDGKPLLVEACPIIEDWDGGDQQDEDTLPEVNCLFSTVGQRIETDEAILWVFDLTFAAKAWYGDQLDNRGILLRPGAAENFAYGDPETTYSKQVTFSGTPVVAVGTSEEFVFTPPPPPPPAPDNAPPAQQPTNTDLFAIPPTTTTTTPVQTGTSVPVTTQTTTEQPAVNQPVTQQPEVSQPVETVTTLAAGTILNSPTTPWYLWLLIPLFLLGSYLYSVALQERFVMASARTGAMTRLLERQAALR